MAASEIKDSRRNCFVVLVRTLAICNILVHCACVKANDVKLNLLPVDVDFTSSSGVPSNRTPTDVKFVEQVQFLRIVPDACRENQTFLVLVVCSALDHFAQRDVIRRTWGGDSARPKHPEVKLIFLLGREPLPVEMTSSSSSAIENEAARFGDIVQADFVDSYANLTVKSIIMLRWATEHCASARFLLKADDDSFVNTPLLLYDLQNTVHQRFVMGSVIARAQPIRRPEAKWYTPTSVFNRTAYPSYVSGAAYVVSGDVIGDLYRAAIETPLFWIEDVFVTGLLRRRVGFQMVVNVKFDGYKDLEDRCSIRKHIVQHRVTPEVMKQLWSDVVQDDVNCGHVVN